MIVFLDLITISNNSLRLKYCFLHLKKKLVHAGIQTSLH
jgi:hypothetical protein